MPSARVRVGTDHTRRWRSSDGRLSTLPIVRARPVRRKGGTWASDVPSEARVAQNAIAPRASKVAEDMGGEHSGPAPAAAPAGSDAGGVRLLVGVVARA